MIKPLAIFLVLAGVVAGSIVAQRRGWFAMKPPGELIDPDFNTKRRVDPLLSPVIIGDPLHRKPTTRIVRSTKTVAAAPATQPPEADAANQEPLVTEPEARQALRLVGSDAAATELWEAAINDSNLSPDDRTNLIEDLNEVGFADPKNPSLDEMPLVIARIQLLETLARDPLDESNAAAFVEAYKDLTAIYEHLTQNQAQVQAQIEAQEQQQAEQAQQPPTQ